MQPIRTTNLPKLNNHYTLLILGWRTRVEFPYNFDNVTVAIIL